MTDRPTKAGKFFILTYGNPGRGDDGLGYHLAAAFRQRYASVEAIWRYQPAIEDAADIAAHDTVIFTDATRAGDAPFTFAALPPAADRTSAFTTHLFTPAEVLCLARSCFQAKADAYMLAIRGYEFDKFSEALSSNGATNLRQAIDFLANWLERAGAVQTASGVATPYAVACGKDGT